MSATMKNMLTALILFCVALVHAQSVTIKWTPSPSPGIASYRLYYGAASGNYSFATNCGLVTTQTVMLPRTGRWFFAITVSDTNGIESAFSNEAAWELKPKPPVLHGETWVRLTPVIECSTNLLDWRAVEGEPTWFPATNSQEFFTTRRLLIERVQLVDGP
jgi:hypothetical protein